MALTAQAFLLLALKQTLVASVGMPAFKGRPLPMQCRYDAVGPDCVLEHARCLMLMSLNRKLCHWCLSMYVQHLLL